MGTVFIGGGGTSEQANDLDKAFRKTVLDQTSSPSCLYIPHAMDQSKHANAHLWFQDSYGFFDSTTLLTDSSDISSDYDAIYLGGGYTLDLMNALATYGLNRSFFQKYLEKNGIVYGGSAGGVTLGKSLQTAREIMRLAEPVSGPTYNGLNVCGGLSFTPHYQGTPEERAKLNQVSTVHNIAVIALNERSGVILQDGQSLIINPRHTYEVNL